MFVNFIYTVSCFLTSNTILCLQHILNISVFSFKWCCGYVKKQYHMAVIKSSPPDINKNCHSSVCASCILKSIKYIIKQKPCSATFSLPLIGALKVKELVLSKTLNLEQHCCHSLGFLFLVYSSTADPFRPSIAPLPSWLKYVGTDFFRELGFIYFFVIFLMGNLFISCELPTPIHRHIHISRHSKPKSSLH